MSYLRRTDICMCVYQNFEKLEDVYLSWQSRGVLAIMVYCKMTLFISKEGWSWRHAAGFNPTFTSTTSTTVS